MPLPNFIIAGAAKAGTTSLYRMLDQHPEVSMSIIKEPNFFGSGWPNWATTIGEYQKLFQHCDGKKAIGEASPFYFSDPQSPERIRDVLGSQVRILLILRNPAKRAYSQWFDEHIKYNRDPLPFKKAIEVEPNRIVSEETLSLKYYYPGLYMYVGVSKYSDKVERFIEVFERNKLMVIIFEEFIKTPKDHFHQICKFLNIDTTFKTEILKSNPAGLTTFPKFTSLISTINQNSVFNQFFRALPPSLQRIIFKLGDAVFRMPIKPVDKEPYQNEHLDKNTYYWLMNEFLPDINKLEQILERDLSIWYGDV